MKAQTASACREETFTFRARFAALCQTCFGNPVDPEVKRPKRAREAPAALRCNSASVTTAPGTGPRDIES